MTQPSGMENRLRTVRVMYGMLLVGLLMLLAAGLLLKPPAPPSRIRISAPGMRPAPAMREI